MTARNLCEPCRVSANLSERSAGSICSPAAFRDRFAFGRKSRAISSALLPNQVERPQGRSAGLALQCPTRRRGTRRRTGADVLRSTASFPASCRKVCARQSPAARGCLRGIADAKKRSSAPPARATSGIAPHLRYRSVDLHFSALACFAFVLRCRRKRRHFEGGLDQFGG